MAGTMELICDKDGRVAITDGTMTLAGDYTAFAKRLAPHALNRELLVRAARLKGLDHVPVAVDATAGLGEDSLLLAAAGFEVTLIERDPLVAAVTADAINRGLNDDTLRDACSRMHLIEGDSAEIIPTLPRPIDIVYLDPMFPARGKDSATKKKLQMVRQLEEPATEAEERRLLEAAYAVSPRRIIVKRPLKGPYLGNRKPSHTISGKLIRYDCLIS
jgi:16S rRNA (guanine1516-N2)-methyltransferase